MPKIIGFGPYTYPSVFPKIVESDEFDYTDNESCDGNDAQMDRFYFDENGDAIYVVDLLDTFDCFGNVVIAVDDIGDIRVYSPNAYFYEVD